MREKQGARMFQGMKNGFVLKEGKPKRETGSLTVPVTGEKDNKHITDAGFYTQSRGGSAEDPGC